MTSMNWNLNVYITHYLDGNPKNQESARRIRQLADLILSLAHVKVKTLNVRIYTNLEDANHLSFISDPLKSRNLPASFKVVTVTRSDLKTNNGYSPWLLTWSHKRDLKLDVEKSNENSLFLYLEDDSLFEQSNLDYFLDSRDILKEFNLIPGFVRAEWSSIHSCWINSDRLTGNLQKDYLLKNAGGKCFKIRQYENPYFASFLLDGELALEYINSDSFHVDKATRKHPIIWDTGATSALGLICENVPEGFLYRTAVLLSELNEFPVIGSVLRHQGDRYANDLWFRQRSLFYSPGEADLPSPERSFRDYLKKGIEIGPKIAFQTLIKRCCNWR